MSPSLLWQLTVERGNTFILDLLFYSLTDMVNEHVMVRAYISIREVSQDLFGSSVKNDKNLTR
jgi:hypothetical protein